MNFQDGERKRGDWESSKMDASGHYFYRPVKKLLIKFSELGITKTKMLKEMPILMTACAKSPASSFFPQPHMKKLYPQKWIEYSMAYNGRQVIVGMYVYSP